MIALTINVTEAEYIEAQRRQQRTSRSKVIRQRIQLTLLCAISIQGVYELARETSAGFEFLCALLTPGYLLLGIALACFRNSALHTSYKKAAVTLNGAEAKIDDTGYHWNTPGQTNGVVYWPAFNSWTETPKTITLVRGGLMYIMQRSAFTEESYAELRNLCIAKLGPET